MVVNVIANVLSNTFFLVNKPFKSKSNLFGRFLSNSIQHRKIYNKYQNKDKSCP